MTSRLIYLTTVPVSRLLQKPSICEPSPRRRISLVSFHIYTAQDTGLTGNFNIRCIGSSSNVVDVSRPAPSPFPSEVDIRPFTCVANNRDSTEVNLVLIAVSIPALSPIIKPKKSVSSSKQSVANGEIVMNTFNSRKRAHAKGLTDTDDGFERLNEESS